MTLTSILGLVGNALFIYSAAPELYRTIRAGKALGTPMDLILTICLGMITMWIYTFLKNGFDLILALNYGIQAFVWFILLYYRLFRYRV
jgi:hypothetical protein